MSRIIVKSLPPKITEDKLRTVFSPIGEITDVSLKFKNGVFRKFAFIGFKTEGCGDKAIKQLDKTYIGTSKIQVENCHDFNSAEKPRPWSRHSVGSSAYQKSHSVEIQKQKEKEQKARQEEWEKNKKSKSTKKVDELLGDLKDSTEFEEFVAVHQNRQNKSLWADDVAKSAKETSGKDSKLDKSVKDALDEDSGSDEEYTDLPEKKSPEKEKPAKKSPQKKKKGAEPTPYVLKMKGITKNCKDRKIIAFFDPLKVCSIRIARNNKKESYGLAYVSFENAETAREAMLKNKTKLGDKKVQLTIPNNAEWNKRHSKYEKLSDDLIADTGRLYVRNLAYQCQLEDLEELFAKFGPVEDVHLPMDHITRKIKGFAFVNFMMPEHAVKAHTELDGKIFQGRILHVLPAKEKPEEHESVEMKEFKKKKEKERKAMAATSHNWNAVFLGASAVADAMAEKYDKSKGEILEEGKQSLGVRMALGETQLVSETRQFLLDQGVALDSFSQADAPRSKRVILVKNLPAGTFETDIAYLFERSCKVKRVILPPSGLSALVECDDPTEAKIAFKRLAYTNFKHKPLFLEWAPVGVFKQKDERDGAETKDEKDGAETGTEKAEKECEESKNEEAMDTSSSSEEEEEQEKKKEKSKKTEKLKQEEKKAPEKGETKEVKVKERKVEETEDLGDPEPDSCLFVKNLNFDTKEDTLREFFKKCGKLHSATISRKIDPKNRGDFLSMGYGFVQFMKKSGAQKALKTLQHKELDGHALELKVSTGRKAPVSTKRKIAEETKQNSSKIMIRNIPFEAQKREIEELFKVFGEIKMTRLPKKMSGGGHRGFGFVDYVSKQDAKKAFDTLCHSTHLYGRRLILEWAENEESIEELREKTAKQFSDEVPRKKMRKKALEDDLKAGVGRD